MENFLIRFSDLFFFCNFFWRVAFGAQDVCVCVCARARWGDNNATPARSRPPFLSPHSKVRVSLAVVWVSGLFGRVGFASLPPQGAPGPPPDKLQNGLSDTTILG